MKAPDIGSEAFRLAEEWSIPVFPVEIIPDPDKPGRTLKQPRTLHGFKDATTDLGQIARWWARDPTYAVGVPTGAASKLLLVDIDPAGEGWYIENTPRLDCGRIHKTQRGWHLVYAMPVGAHITNSAGTVAPGVDVRGEGGFMVWWPATGGDAIGGMEDIKLPPEWLRALLTEKPKAAVVQLEPAQGFIGDGKRNDFLSREAYRQKKLGVNDDQLFAILGAINQARCRPVLSDRELATIIYGKKNIGADPSTAEGEAIPAISARPFTWRDPKSIPPRQWLYAKHYMRGMASATAGIGGAGKSTMLLTEAIGASMGRNLLTNESLPVGPLNVWIHNGEDPFEELERRVAAIMLHFKIQPEDWQGRLYLTSGRDMPILVAEALSDGGKLFVPRQEGELLKAELIAKKIDIFIADPFITIHRVNENDNGLIDSVMGLLRDIAHQAQCALEVAHHLRKLNGGDVGIDDIRGAGSIVGACRSVRLMAAMTQEEAQRYGVEDKDRKAFSWIVNGKANMLPPGHAREWVHAVGVDLGNAAGVYESDNVGALERWLPPESFLELTAAEYHLVRKTLQETRREDLRYDSRAKEWAGKVIANVLGKDIADKAVRGEMLGLIERWKKAGKLKLEEFHDGRRGRSIAVVRWVDKATEVE